MKKIAITLLALILIVPISIGNLINAEEVTTENLIGIKNNDDDYYKKIILNNKVEIEKIEKELNESKTDVITELENFIEESHEYLSNEEWLITKNAIEQDINKIKQNKKIKYEEKAVMPPGEIELIANQSDRDIAIAAIAYFNLKGYKLSSNLLNRAINIRSSKEYKPSNKLTDFLYKTVAYNALKNKHSNPPNTRRSAVFQNRYNKYEADAYYAIHKFTVELTNNKIKISDIYDFKNDGNYNGAVDYATEALVRMQRRGDLVPFKLTIHLLR